MGEFESYIQKAKESLQRESVHERKLGELADIIREHHSSEETRLGPACICGAKVTSDSRQAQSMHVAEMIEAAGYAKSDKPERQYYPHYSCQAVGCPDCKWTGEDRDNPIPFLDN